jgi:hypothetical protein
MLVRPRESIRPPRRGRGILRGVHLRRRWPTTEELPAFGESQHPGSLCRSSPTITVSPSVLFSLCRSSQEAALLELRREQKLEIGLRHGEGRRTVVVKQ